MRGKRVKKLRSLFRSQLNHEERVQLANDWKLHNFLWRRFKKFHRYTDLSTIKLA